MQKMGNGNGNGSVAGTDPLWWVVGGTIATIVGYNLFKTKHPADQIAPVAPKEPPPSFSSLNDVATRFGQVRELWTMGYLNPEETVTQLTSLMETIAVLQRSGQASAASAQELSGRISSLIEDVLEYQQLQAGVPA